MARKTDNPSEPIGPPELPSDAMAGSTDAQQNDPAAGLAGSADIIIPEGDLDTPESDAAIDEIVTEEADQILAAQDNGIDAEQADTEPDNNQEKHGHPIFWFIILLLVVLAAIFAYVLMNPDLDLPFSA